MRHVNPSHLPEWADTNLNPPDSTDDWNEWWEHVFATVYWINVRNDLGVHDWQVHNEPNRSGQGWNGTLADYVTFTQYTADAIQYVYDTYLPGEEFKLYAPVAAACNDDGSTWMQTTMANNDDIVDVLDSHWYEDPAPCAQTMQDIITNYDTDGIHEETFLTEWGTYRQDYERFSDAMFYGRQLMSHSFSDSPIDGSNVFVTWDWGSAGGILDAPGVPTPTYYAFRLLIRGLQGGKQRYVIAESPPSSKIDWVAAVDQPTNTMYVTFRNYGGGAKDETITLDVSAHVTSGTATYYKFADGVNDEVVGTDSLNNGVVTFTLPKSSFFLVEVPVGPPPPTPTPTDTLEPTATATEGSSPTPSDTPIPPTDTPGSETIFFDGFEDGDMSDWTVSGGNAQIRGDYPYQGSYCAGAEQFGWFKRTISTAGYTGIHLKYAGMTRNMDAGESLTVEWYDSSQWHVIDELLSNDIYVLRDWTLPAGAENNPDFAIRFTGNADRNKEWGYADNVEVTGQ
jgi:hypothetical protein